MNMETPPLPEDAATEPTSLGGRLFNIIAAPGEVYEELRVTPPRHSNWLVPTLLSMLMGILFSVVAFSQPDIVADVLSQQEAQMASQVEAGKMTQEQADNALATVRRFQSPKILMFFGIGGSMFGTIFFVLLVSLLVWVLIAQFFKARIPFLKAMELVGLAGMVGVIGSVLTLLIVMWKGSVMAGPSLGLLLGSFDQTSYLHQMLNAVNLVTIWYLVILTIGISKVSGRALPSAAIPVFLFWGFFRFGIAAASAWWARVQSGM